MDTIFSYLYIFISTQMIKLPAYFTRFGSRADGSAGLSFATQELSPEEFSELSKCLNQFGWLIFKGNSISLEDLPLEDAQEGKKPSQRLRAALYVLWEQNGKVGDFEAYYRTQMEKVIEHVKKKLE